MPIQNQSSFIPKEGMGTNRPRRESTMGVFMLVSLLILGVSILTFAGAYAYQYILDLQINKPCAGDGTACGLKATVEKTRSELGIEEISRYNRLDKKMKVAQSLIDGHTTLLPVFDMLERLTLHTVRFTKFQFDGKEIELEGSAVGYTDLAAQLKVFEESNVIQSAVFSDLGLDQQGNVTFVLNMVPNSSLLTFSTN